MNHWDLKIGKKFQKCLKNRAFVEKKLRSDRNGSTIWTLRFQMRTGIVKSFRHSTVNMIIWVQNGV